MWGGGRMAQVFISYSKRDYVGDDGNIIPGNVVDLICKALSDNDISYWIDREGLAPGVTYADTISKNIKECDTFLFLSTENANSSPWTLREISTAIDFGKTVLPVKLDQSRFADSVALYLASVQYIDWNELGVEESLHRIVSRLKGDGQEPSLRHFGKERLSRFTSTAIYTGIVFLTGIYACLTYLFLWAGALRSSEIMGGLIGYVCEVGVLLSIYYLIRMLRLRRCTFLLPAGITLFMFLSGMLFRDGDVMLSAIFLFLGWIFILAVCLVKNARGRNFFRIMGREQMIIKATDPENLIILYLVIKAVIIVFAHYIGLPIERVFISASVI